MRNRPRLVWKDYNEHTKFAKEAKAALPLPPKISLSKSHKTEIRQDLKNAGFNKALIDKWEKGPPDKAQFKKENMDKYFDKYSELLGQAGKAEKNRLNEAFKDFKKLLKRARSDKSVYRIIQDFYALFAGI